MSESRHDGARRIGVRIVDLPVSVTLRLGPVTSELSKLVQAGPDRPVGKLLGRELVACVAVTANRAGGIVGELLAASLLRNLLPIFPIAEQISIGRILDGRQIERFNFLRDVAWRCLAGEFAAKVLRSALNEDLSIAAALLLISSLLAAVTQALTPMVMIVALIRGLFIDFVAQRLIAGASKIAPLALRAR